MKKMPYGFHIPLSASSSCVTEELNRQPNRMSLCAYDAIQVGLNFPTTNFREDYAMNKDRFRAHFREYVQGKLRTSFDDLNDKQRSVWMARFYADKVIRSLNPGIVPETEEDFEACSIDGKDDCGVDFLCKEGNTVLVLQAKYSGEKKKNKAAAEDFDAFDFFRGVLSRLYSGPKDLRMNTKLKEAITDIDWDRDAFLLHYITLQRPAGNSFALAEKGIDPIPELPDITERASLELFDEERLNVQLRDAVKQESAVLQTIKLSFSPGEDDVPWIRYEDTAPKRRSYVGRVTGSHIAELFRQYKSGLFTLNIRNYIGDTKTNQDIRRTATLAPQKFFYANNGICAVATRIRPDDVDSCALLCDRFSIINGAQTVRSLAKAHSENSESLRNVRVLLRLVEYDSKVTQAEQRFLDNVIKNNNTQNAIKTSDFRSNDSVQISIKKHFQNVPALKGKSFVYRNKRTGERTSSQTPVPMEEFIKTVHAFEFGPADVYGGTAYLFNTDKDGGYGKLFGDGTEIKNALTETEFQELAGIWFLCDFVKELWKGRPAEPQTPELERRWLVFWAVGESLRTFYDTQLDQLAEDIRRLANPRWLDPANPKGNYRRMAIKKHYELAALALQKVYSRAKEKQNFSHRNWFRNEDTLRMVKVELKTFVVLIAGQEEYRLAKAS